MPDPTPSLTCRGCHRLLIPRRTYANAAPETRARWKAANVRANHAREMCLSCYKHERTHGDTLAQPIRTVPAAPTRTDWTVEARCIEVDPDLWFPDIGDQNDVVKAKRICGECPVRTECLGAAIERGELFGVWGGMTPRQRQALKRESAA